MMGFDTRNRKARSIGLGFALGRSTCHCESQTKQASARPVIASRRRSNLTASLLFRFFNSEIEKTGRRSPKIAPDTILEKVDGHHSLQYADTLDAPLKLHPIPFLKKWMGTIHSTDRLVI